jgi:hypothetical protein
MCIAKGRTIIGASPLGGRGPARLLVIILAEIVLPMQGKMRGGGHRRWARLHGTEKLVLAAGNDLLGGPDAAGDAAGILEEGQPGLRTMCIDLQVGQFLQLYLLDVLIGLPIVAWTKCADAVAYVRHRLALLKT